MILAGNLSAISSHDEIAEFFDCPRDALFNGNNGGRVNNCFNLINKLLGTKQGQLLVPELAVVLLAIFLIEFLCFFPVLRHIGFYLDDWVMLNYLSLGPGSFLELLQFYFSTDPRVVNRPLEAIHFILMFKLFGLKPLGYHIFNCLMEILSACFLYLSLKLLSGCRKFSFISSALFLLYPSHNITHYWVVSSSVGLSMLLYLGALYCDLQGAKTRRLSLHILSAFLFYLSLLNYEVCLPLAALNVVFVTLVVRKQTDWRQAIIYGVRPAVCLALAISGLFVYLKFIMPMLGTAWMHRVSFETGLMFATIGEGIRLNLPWVAFGYFGEHALGFVRDNLGLRELVLLVAQILVFWSTCYYLDDKDKQQLAENVAVPPLSGSVLVLLGSFGVVISYTIFGLNSEYMPTFITFVNRVNTGATVGLAVLVLGVLLICRSFVSEKGLSLRLISLLTVTGLILVCFYTVTNWSLAKPFVISWQLQSHIFKFFEQNQSQFKKASSILLANAPRYAGESPVFDGTWDFQSMLRIALKREDINGGVVCDRLEISKEDLKDKSKGGFLCATYPFERMYLLFSPTCEVKKVENAIQFIDLVEQRGMQFELNKELPSIWRKQLEGR